MNFDEPGGNLAILNTDFQMKHDVNVKTTIGIGLNYSF